MLHFSISSLDFPNILFYIVLFNKQNYILIVGVHSGSKDYITYSHLKIVALS